MAPKRTNEGASSSAIESTASSTGPLGPKVLQELKAILLTNRLKIQDPMAKHKYPEVIAHAAKFVSRKRNSDMDEATQQLAVGARNLYAVTNERTFVSEVWKHLHKEWRDKRIAVKPGSELDGVEWTTAAWQLDFLEARWDYEFRRESIPRLENVTPTIFKCLAATPRVANPKPDLAYGISYGALTEEEFDVSRTYPQYSEVSPGICFAFFAAEFKGSGGTMEEAEIQACRGGAAMVNAVRELAKVAKTQKKDAGADMSSFAFTLAMVPISAFLHVHWAEVVPGKQTVYHMHKISSYDLTEAETYPVLRRDLNNILDWGLSVRLKECKALLNTIHKDNCSAPPSKKQKTAAEESEKGTAEAEQGDGEVEDEVGD